MLGHGALGDPKVSFVGVCASDLLHPSGGRMDLCAFVPVQPLCLCVCVCVCVCAVNVPPLFMAGVCLLTLTIYGYPLHLNVST